MSRFPWWQVAAGIANTIILRWAWLTTPWLLLVAFPVCFSVMIVAVYADEGRRR